VIRLAKDIRKGTKTISRRREVTLTAELQTSISSHMVVLRKLVLMTQRKIHVMDSAIRNTTSGISRFWTLDNMHKVQYGTMKSTLAQEAVKD
jgi:hypothetical protein